VRTTGTIMQLRVHGVIFDLADVSACLTERRGRITFGMSSGGWGSRTRQVHLLLTWGLIVD
jgi:hypothetical protein